MSISRQHIQDEVQSYLEGYPAETDALRPMTSLLASGVDITSRTEFRGHTTAGAIVLNESGDVLHVHHKALDMWLLPGGHLESTDDSLQQAALRELCEETGIPGEEVCALGIGPVHIDMHTVPANPLKGEPPHPHFDFRYLFSTTAETGKIQAEEIIDCVWVPISGMRQVVLRERIPAVLASPSREPS